MAALEQDTAVSTSILSASLTSSSSFKEVGGDWMGIFLLLLLLLLESVVAVE